MCLFSTTAPEEYASYQRESGDVLMQSQHTDHARTPNAGGVKSSKPAHHRQGVCASAHKDVDRLMLDISRRSAIAALGLVPYSTVAIAAAPAAEKEANPKNDPYYQGSVSPQKSAAACVRESVAVLTRQERTGYVTARTLRLRENGCRRAWPTPEGVFPIPVCSLRFLVLWPYARSDEETALKALNESEGYTTRMTYALTSAG